MHNYQPVIMAELEAFPFRVEILDLDRFNRGVGATALRWQLGIVDPFAEVNLTEDLETPLVRVGGYDFPGRVELPLLGRGASLAVVQIYDIPRPLKYSDIPDAANLSPTMADAYTGVRGHILAQVPSGEAAQVVVTEIWARNITDFDHGVLDALTLLLPFRYLSPP